VFKGLNCVQTSTCARDAVWLVVYGVLVQWLQITKLQYALAGLPLKWKLFAEPLNPTPRLIARIGLGVMKPSTLTEQDEWEDEHETNHE